MRLLELLDPSIAFASVMLRKPLGQPKHWRMSRSACLQVFSDFWEATAEVSRLRKSFMPETKPELRLGKTTLFNLIQGHLLPDRTDPACNVFIDGRSIITSRNNARSRLGVCPQATALESVLTVREHLVMYARCKGLRGEDLERNVECIMTATQLIPYAHKYANKLSGGNQVRKLCLFCVSTF